MASEKLITPEKLVTPESIGSQTVGPYYAIGLDYLVNETLAAPNVAGRHLTLSGTVFDANDQPVPDAVVELWQASADGTYSDLRPPGNFFGFTRLSTHDNGRFTAHTIEPGSVPYLDGRPQAPHIVVLLFMRGLMRHLVTRVYFPNHRLNDFDPVLQLIPSRRRSTLIAQPVDAHNQQLQWDIHLQGEQETVFFEC